MEEGRGSGWEKASVLIRERWGKRQWRRRGGAGGGGGSQPPPVWYPRCTGAPPLPPRTDGLPGIHRGSSEGNV